ncbi:uncharacterized protein LOC142347996 [Convolutriloba macropyga]|uniref:uncharacterized protein LOC142347996 n=1 Tax=Convolutriloba macropyga TaxID=536237 RepID=UPI003F526446
MRQSAVKPGQIWGSSAINVGPRDTGADDKSEGMTNRFWLGITDVETQGKWVNSHGRDVEALMMWDSGQPSNQINENATKASVRVFWLGVTDEEKEHRWVNSNGRDVGALMSWDSGQPSNEVNEHWSFVMVRGGECVVHDGHSKWNFSYACSIPQPFAKIL